MTTQLDVETFALEVADFFRRTGHPIYGVEVKPGNPFPLVLLWDDDLQISRVIACTCDESELADALLYSVDAAAREEEAGNAPCGAIGCMAWPGGWREING